MNINELWEKPLDHKFGLREISLILQHIREKRYKAVYAIYNKKSSKGLYVTFMIDYIPNSTRLQGLKTTGQEYVSATATSIATDLYSVLPICKKKERWQISEERTKIIQL